MLGIGTNVVSCINFTIEIRTIQQYMDEQKSKKIGKRP